MGHPLNYYQELIWPLIIIVTIIMMQLPILYILYNYIMYIIIVLIYYLYKMIFTYCICTFDDVFM